jgi:hypothetical protein
MRRVEDQDFDGRFSRSDELDLVARSVTAVAIFAGDMDVVSRKFTPLVRHRADLPNHTFCIGSILVSYNLSCWNLST